MNREDSNNHLKLLLSWRNVANDRQVRSPENRSGTGLFSIIKPFFQLIKNQGWISAMSFLWIY